jgi:hypothetical protein
MADDNKEAAGQLDIQNQINNVLKNRTAILKNQSKFLSAQTQIAIELCSALECSDLDGMQDRLGEIQSGLSEAAEEARNLESSTQAASSSINSMADGGAKKGGLLSKVFSPMGGMFAGLGVGMMSAFKGATNMVGGFLKSAGRITGIVGNIGKSLIMLPFSLLNNLTSFAAGAAGGVSALRTATEELKETFGSMNSNEGQQVMQGFKNMRKQTQSLGGSGIRMSRIFGPGMDGLGAALKAVGEQMSDLGPMMSQFGDEVQKNAGVFEVYRRGLGLTGDNFKSLASLAQTTGQSLESTLDTVGSQAINMGKQFGVSSKLIAGDMASMLGDVANFGTLSIKQVSSLAVYTRKLGIEAKELNSVIDKWDNFEDAAAGASKLSQSFGMNIDAMQMMKEADPGKRMDMMRESFQATGKSVEDLSRQELKLLASQMGLSEEAAKKALSSDMDYDDIMAGSEDAEAKTISQAEAMKELADAMKQTFGSGGDKPKTFMDALTKGFEKGIMRGKGMRQMFRNINKSMKQVYLFGRDLGKMFVDLFPGVQTMVKALTDLFSPSRFRKLRTDLLGAFRQLFLDLRTDPKGGVETFAEKLKKIFGNFFDGSTGPGKAFLDGLKTFGKTVLLLFLAMVPMMMKGLAGLIHKLADFIRDPSAFTDAAVGMGDGLQQALSGAWEAIVDTWPILRDAFYDLFDAMKPALKGLWKTMWPWILKAIIFKTILAVAGNMAMGGAWGLLAKTFKKMFSKTTEVPKVKSPPKQTTSSIKSIGETLRAVANMDPMVIGKAILNMAMIIAFVGVSLVGLGFALKYAVGAVADVDSTKLAIMSAVLIGLMVSMLPMATAAIALKAVSWKDMAKSMLKIGIVVAGMAVLIGLVGLAIKYSPDLDMGHITNFFTVMGVILAAALVAILIAIPVGFIADKFGAQITTGLLVLGAVMIALGAIGLIVGGMLSFIPNPEGVSKLMNAISVLMTTAAIMIPIAGGLGLMLMSFPFGTAGVGIILAGFGVMGTIVAALVGSVMPTIHEIANMQISDPDKVKTIVDMIVSVINAIANFTSQFAQVLKALKPPPDSAADQMAKNISAAKGLLDALLKNGINDVIDKITEIAKNTDITGTGVAAGQAIAGVLSAIGNIMGAMSPSVIADVANSSEGIDNDKVGAAIDAMTRFANASGRKIIDLVQKIGPLIGEIAKHAKGMDGPGIEFVKAMTPMFSTMGEIARAMQPNPAALQAMSGGSEGHDNDEWANTIGAMGRFAAVMGPQIAKVMKSMGPVMAKVVHAIKGLLQAIPDVPAEKLAAAAGLIGPILEALTNIMKVVFPLIRHMLHSTKNKDGTANMGKLRTIATTMTEVMGAVGGMLSQMQQPLSDMMTSILAAASTITNPERALKQVDVIVKSLEAVKTLMEMFNPDTSSVFSSFMSSADKVQYTLGGRQVSTMSAALHSMKSFTDRVLAPGGPLQNLITAMGAITITSSETRNLNRLGPAIEAMQKIFSLVDTVKGMAVSGDISGVGKQMTDTFKALADVPWSKGKDASGGSLEALLEKVGSGNWTYSPRTIAARAKGVEALGEFLGAYNPVARAISSASAATNIWDFYNLDMSLSALATNLENVSATVAPGMEERFTTAAATVTSMLQNYAELNELLATIGPLDINGNLNRFGESMAITTDTITIENKPINITVNFNVTMNADDIALAISDKGTNRTQGKNTVQLSRQGGHPVGAD